MALKDKLLQRMGVRNSKEKNSIAEENGFRAAKINELFPATDPAVDGEECLHDCDSCTIHLPRKFEIDQTDQLYGHVNGWDTHMIVATGKTDWVRSVEDEPGSIMEAVGKGQVQPQNGKLMLSASNIPLPDHASERGTSVLLLPSFKFVDHVTPALVPELIRSHVDTSPTNKTPLGVTPDSAHPGDTDANQTSSLTSRPCPHTYLILVCSQKTRDARCGQSAPLLRREFERHLRPLGLYRDLNDDRPGGVGIYFISHVGGHKYSANCMIYRSANAPVVSSSNGTSGEHAAEANAPIVHEHKPADEAGQCIWLARVRPEDCENIIRYTVLQGKVVKPARQLRGGFDRQKGLASW